MKEGLLECLWGETVSPLECRRCYSFLWPSKPLKLEFLLCAIMADREGEDWTLNFSLRRILFSHSHEALSETVGKNWLARWLQQ